MSREPSWDGPAYDLSAATSAEPPPPDPYADVPPVADAPRFEFPPLRATELDALLAEPDPDHDWLVPGHLECRDRLIITGPEGGGKSTLLRQLAVQYASGVHPWRPADPDARFEPLRVLLPDLENGTLRMRRELRKVRQAAAGLYRPHPRGLHTVADLTLDVALADDRARLLRLADDVEPDVLITGPIYQLGGTGEAHSEERAHQIAALLDRIRHEHGCAVILEAHTPHEGNGGGPRPIRPIGSSLWRRWPEFGIYVPDGGGPVEHWRGPRDEREWPARLEHGGPWPWMPVGDLAPVVGVTHTEAEEEALGSALRFVRMSAPASRSKVIDSLWADKPLRLSRRAADAIVEWSVREGFVRAEPVTRNGRRSGRGAHLWITPKGDRRLDDDHENGW